MKQKRILRVVVASPQDVRAERDALPAVVEGVNREIAAGHGLRLRVLRWETDAYAGFHTDGPQGLIDAVLNIEDCDIFVGIFWKRFGTPTKDAPSGTAHEFRLAYEAWRRKGHPQILFYFKQKPYMPQTEEETIQQGHVLRFKDNFPSEGLWYPYKTRPEFVGLVRQHLGRVVRHEFAAAPRAGRAPGGPPARRNAALLAQYRTHLARLVGRVYLPGEAQPRDLEKVFVELRVAGGYRPPSLHAEFLGMMDAEMRRRRNPFAREDGGRGGDGHARTVVPDELLRDRTRAVITGAPGCGKTTLLRYLALKTLKGGERLPLFLELKAVTEDDFKAARGDLVELLFDRGVARPLYLGARGPEREQFKKYVFGRLAAGKVSIFLDGLDEVSGTGLFAALRAAVGEFLRSAYGHNALAISTRPYALKSPPDGVDVLEIEPLNEVQVEQFARHYYGEDDGAVEGLYQLRQHLPTRELMSVPFLLLMTLQLHRRERRLAEDQLELYERIVRHLVGQMDHEKALPFPRFQVLDPDGSLKLDFLAHLACERLLMGYVNARRPAKESARLTFSGDVLREEARRFLESESAPEASPRLLALDVRATPLLREVGDDVYAFTHLTVQEYLAAKSLAARPDREGIFCRAYFNPTLAGMEVLPMALGLVRPPGALHAAVEQLPESLSFTNLRLRVRGLAYAPRLGEPHLSRIAGRLAAFAAGRSVEDIAYRRTIVAGVPEADERFPKAVAELLSRLRRQVEDENPIDYSHQKSVMRLRHEADIFGMIETLKRGSAYSRAGVAHMLAIMADARALPALLDAMKDEDGSVRREAAHALGRIGDPSAIPALVAALKDKESWARMYAARALGEIADARALPALLDAIRHGDEDLRAGAAYALGRIGDPRAVAPLLEAMKDEYRPARAEAVQALGRIGDPRAVPALLAALRADDVRGQASHGGVYFDAEDVREEAAYALVQFGGEEVVSALLGVLGDEDDNYSARKAAAYALGRLGDARAVPALLAALKDKDRSVRYTAATALGMVGESRAVPALLAALRDSDFAIRSSAAEALEMFGDESLARGLEGALSDKDAHVRGRAAQVIGYYTGGPHVLEKLGRMAARDKDKRARLSAAEALSKLGRKMQYFR